ncbi:L domain-like protein [Choiromyces venosus 120613-1]|uniref:L domain-like protein n=1 Tax=Choiromyces venosus 120613-1 TaxID=1336337 RepID=A0A3N4JDW5_9PEZI|nr:L domain-like protein [Choiromyces venosus 120613-1]
MSEGREVDSPVTEEAPTNGKVNEVNDEVREEETSRPATASSVPASSTPAPAGFPRRTLSSRLPRPRKVLPAIPPPITVGSLRPSASDILLSVRSPKVLSPRGPPTIPKRGQAAGSATGIPTDPPGSPVIRTPRRPNFGTPDHASPTTASLAKRASVPSLNRKPSTPSLSRKASASQLQNSIVSTPPGRRTSDINGNVAPRLAKKPSASQLIISKRPSNTQLSKKPSAAQLNSPTPTASPSPMPFRRVASTHLPSPQSPTVAKIPNRPSLTQLRQASVGSNGAPTLRAQKTQKPAAPSAPSPESPSPKKAPRAASQSLRDTIAKARAAHRAMSNTTKPPASLVDVVNAEAVNNDLNGFNFSSEDPFNQAIFGEGGSIKVLKQRIKTARVEGRLNISNLQLNEIPGDVYKMYETTDEDLASNDTNDDPKWYESVDLVRFVGADNEIEAISKDLVKHFRGLASIDMHNNLLAALPQNFGELTELTVLNLTNNKLDNGALGIICQISSLVDLKLSKNGLEGELDSSISKLTNLEILELQENKLESLPSSLGQLPKLHILNVSHNVIQSIPFGSLLDCQLHELTASNNKLKGALFPHGVTRFDSLHLLDIRNNHISVFSEDDIVLSSLQQLIATNNGLLSFPSVAGWEELLVFLVDSNRLDSLPDGLVGLHRVRTVDVSANDIKTLDARVGAMEGLEVLKFDGNPLRERQLLGMSIADLKRTLKGRLAPPEIVIAEAEDDDPTEIDGSSDTRPQAISEDSKILEVGRGGVLDLASQNYEDISKELMDTVRGTPSSVSLLHNRLTAFPLSLEIFALGLTSLNIGHNKLSGNSYFPHKMSLTSLTTLVIQANNITSLQPLIDNLDVPKLDTLDVSANRLTSIEGIRPTFPYLIAFYARDNQITDIPVDSVDGIRILDLSSNAITSLPPKLGTLSSIRELRVSGNLFRVPRWQVLEKGTESVMEWLRGRLPVDDEQVE